MKNILKINFDFVRNIISVVYGTRDGIKTTEFQAQQFNIICNKGIKEKGYYSNIVKNTIANYLNSKGI